MKKEKLQQIIQKYYLYYHKNVRNDHKKILSATILEKEMTTHSSILAGKIPWTEEPGGLQSLGSQRVGDDSACT